MDYSRKATDVMDAFWRSTGGWDDSTQVEQSAADEVLALATPEDGQTLDEGEQAVAKFVAVSYTQLADKGQASEATAQKALAFCAKYAPIAEAPPRPLTMQSMRQLLAVDEGLASLVSALGGALVGQR